MPAPHDLLPALLLPAFVLIVFALVMPVTGARAARREASWARFDALCRVRGLSSPEREALAGWARVTIPEKPYDVLVRRKDFDRFARTEAARLRSAGPAAHAEHLEQLGRLRERLGFGRRGGPPQSSHDLAPGDRLSLRLDDGERIDLQALGIDEAGIQARFLDAPRRELGPGWAIFARDGEGTYRFRTEARRSARGLLLTHGRFLVREERRQDARVTVRSEPFWGAVERLPDGAAPEDPEGVELEVIDVSAGGAAFLADRAVRRGARLWLDLPLGDGDGGPRIRGVRADVLGAGFREGGGRRPYFVHCAFTSLEPIQRRVLEAYVASRTANSHT